MAHEQPLIERPHVDVGRVPPAIDRRRGTPPTGLDRGRSSGLDGLRALAALLVVAFHLNTVSGVSFGPLDVIIRGGDTGVYVFFALSGYLLYKPFLQGPGGPRRVWPQARGADPARLLRRARGPHPPDREPAADRASAPVPDRVVQLRHPAPRVPRQRLDPVRRDPVLRQPAAHRARRSRPRAPGAGRDRRRLDGPGDDPPAAAHRRERLDAGHVPARRVRVRAGHVPGGHRGEAPGPAAASRPSGLPRDRRGVHRPRGADHDPARRPRHGRRIGAPHRVAAAASPALAASVRLRRWRVVRAVPVAQGPAHRLRAVRSGDGGGRRGRVVGVR